MDLVKIAEDLGIKFNFDFDSLDNKTQIHQLRRKVRYNCYAAKRLTENGEDHAVVPKKFLKYFEEQPGFEGWQTFSVVWDVKKDNPTELYFRDFSVDEEWEATLRRVVPTLEAVDRTARRN